MSSSHTTTGLFGIDFCVSKVESLLDMESPDVLIVGIWGMGGIGKTTIAEAVCSKVCSRFKGIFFQNFRQQSDLRRSFLSWLLGQETLNTMGFLSFRDSFVRERLRRIKVFIVLDDVDDLMLFEEWKDLLDGRNSSFGPGSKVLITSRDKQVLSNVVDETYEVKGLNDEEAIQLFSLKALKNCIPTIDYRHLIDEIGRHVQGNPLALKVLGSSLYGKSIEKWRSALNKLAQHPRIEMALRISYNGLDSEQKSIFLDIAHFFIGRKQDEATRILDCLYGRSVTFDISTLIDKCLITTSNDYFHRDKLEMHDLLREMAFNIVRAESDFPGERSRLCYHPDVIQVLEENKGTQKIKGMYLNWLSRHIHLKSDAFAMMDGLRFLSFSHTEATMHLPPAGLEYLPNELRYLRWDGFPSKSLPPSFRAEHLVELHLRESKLEKLWTGVKDVGNLRTIDLSNSPYLTELPDLSMAKNLVSLDLVDCPSLTEVPSSLQYLDKLEKIDLRSCYNLRSFPMLDSKVLSFLIISWCPDMTTCPMISQNMVWLQLEQTSIKEVPQSVTGKLKYLYLSGCSKMTKFPENLKDIEVLELRGTAIKEVPSSIQFLTRLKVLDMRGCSKLESFPEITVPMKSLEILYLSKTGIKEIPSSSFKHMVCLTTLFLDGIPIKELPLSIKDMVCLRHLTFHGTAIKALPQLPSSLPLRFQRDFTNCFKLDQKQLIEAMHLKIQSVHGITDDRIHMVLPGSEIPEWFGDKGIGSSLTIQLPSNCNQLKGIAFCLVFLLPPPSQDMPYKVDDINVNLYLDYHVKSKNSEHDGDDEVILDSQKTLLLYWLRTCDSDHMILHYELELVNHLRKYSGNEVTFKFYWRGMEDHESRRPSELKSCGVYLHFAKKFKRKFWEI